MGPVELWGKQYTMGRLRLLLMAEWSCRDTQKTLLKTIVMGHPLGATTKSFPASLPRIPIILPSPICADKGNPLSLHHAGTCVLPEPVGTQRLKLL